VLRRRKSEPDKSPGTALLWLSKTEGVASGHYRGATGNTDGIGHVSIGELHPLRAKPIEMRGIDIALLAPERLDVPVAEIIG